MGGGPCLGEEVAVASEILSGNVLQALWSCESLEGVGLPMFWFVQKKRQHSPGQVPTLILGSLTAPGPRLSVLTLFKPR